MKKSFLLSLAIALIIGLLTACGNESSNQAPSEDTAPETKIYHSETGDIEIPAQPKRIAMLTATYAGNLLSLGITPISVNQYPKTNKFYGDMLDDVELVTEDSLEKLIELEPDLIIAYNTDKNLKKYEEIAPTISLTYDKYNYLEQHLEIGKIVGKEKEAQAWIDEWQEKAAAAREKVQAAIGEDATAMIFESYGKDMYVYGQNWGRGGEVIYQALGLKAPEKIQNEVIGTGWKAISAEVIPEFAGDYIFVGEGGSNIDNSFMETDVWKNIPAVKNNQVITFDSESFYFNDPISLEKELEYVVEKLTEGK